MFFELFEELSQILNTHEIYFWSIVIHEMTSKKLDLFWKIYMEIFTDSR